MGPKSLNLLKLVDGACMFGFIESLKKGPICFDLLSIEDGADMFGLIEPL